MELLHLNKVSMNYGRFRALNDISIEIRPGLFGLLGPNGAGKTTLMRILATLIPPKSGEINYGPLSWNNPNEVRRIIGYLPQKFSLYKHVKLREALNHIAVLKGIVDNREKEVDSVIEKVHLTAERDKKVGKLSGGMVRRLGIAQAILGNPKIIIVDEPTAGLDPEERVKFRRMLTHLGGRSMIIISTHIVEDVEVACDQVAVLHKGNLLAAGDIQSLKERARGKVFEIETLWEEFDKVSEQSFVVAAHRNGETYRMRILTDAVPPGAKPVEPTLEDGYLYLVRSGQ